MIVRSLQQMPTGGTVLDFCLHYSYDSIAKPEPPRMIRFWDPQQEGCRMEQFDVLVINGDPTGFLADKGTPLSEGQYYQG